MMHITIIANTIKLISHQDTVVNIIVVGLLHCPLIHITDIADLRSAPIAFLKQQDISNYNECTFPDNTNIYNY